MCLNGCSALPASGVPRLLLPAQCSPSLCWEAAARLGLCEPQHSRSQGEVSRSPSGALLFPP